MPIDSRFRAGGLASGLDSNGIIDQLVALEKRPIDLLTKRQDALQTQVSLLGDLASRLSSVQAAASKLNTSGVLELSVNSTTTSFSTATTTGGTSGRFSVQVKALAQAAKARSDGFAAGETVTGGTLNLSVMGKPYTVALTDGMTLAQAAAAVNQAGAPISAVVLSDGTKEYLSLTNRDTGYPLSGGAAGALAVTESSTGLSGKPLALAVTDAVNAVVEVDGLTMTRMNNEVGDAVPGVRLSLKSVGAKEDLVLGYDVSGTQKNIQSLVDAYNGALSQVQRQLNVAKGSDRSKTLAGDSVVRNLQAALQRIASTTVPGLGSVRTLADLGVQTNRDGGMSINSSKLSAAITRDPAAVDALFNTATTGIGAVISSVVTQFTQPSSGLISSRRDGLNKNIRQMDTTLEQMNTRLSGYKQNLISQFSAMESVVSGFKSIGNYLANNPLPKIGSSS